MKKTIIAFVVVLALIAIGVYVFLSGMPEAPTNEENTTITTQTDTQQNTDTGHMDETEKPVETIGTSVNGNDITAYHYGKGTDEVLFIGGIHGGYGWNTVLVAYNLMDYLSAHPEVIPANVKVTVIPVMNPDGLQKVVGTTGRFSTSDVSSSQATKVSGRFNGNDVDLNRNFDCDWQETGTWQTTKISGGSSVFSEPESQAVKSYIESYYPIAVVVWYSAAGGVYSSNCHGGVLTETKTLTQTYALASGYPAYESYNYYVLTGDLTNWLAKINIPAISVLLTNHQDVEWDKNEAGVKAVIEHFAQ